MASAMATCALIAPFASCGDDDSDATADETTTSTSETTIASTSTTQGPEAEVEAAYLAYWEMFKRLVGAPNPDDPEIGSRVGGTAREDLLDALTTMQAAGEAYTFGTQDSVRVVTIDVDADTATVAACAVADATLAPEPAEPAPADISTSLFEAELSREGRVWIVDSVREVKSWPGATDCSE